MIGFDGIGWDKMGQNGMEWKAIRRIGWDRIDFIDKNNKIDQMRKDKIDKIDKTNKIDKVIGSGQDHLRQK